MRAFLPALIAALVAAAPAAAGTWEPTRSLSHSRQVAVGPDGSTLLGWGAWNDPAGIGELWYARVADDGSLGADMLVASRPGDSSAAGGGGGGGGAVFDRDGNATLIFGFDDDSDYGGDADCCHRYETALLPQGAEAAVARERIEPSGFDRTGLDVAVTPGGARVGAWFVDRPYGAASRIQVLDAPAGRGFGEPRTIADERVQEESFARVMAERGRAAWVIWTTERKAERHLTTAVRVARREPGERRWNVRTIARRSQADEAGLRINGFSLQAATGRAGELVVAWHECDAAGCRLRARWRRSRAWEPAQSVGDEGVATGGWGLAMDRRGRALIAFDACGRREDGTVTDECALRVASGQEGRFDSPTDLAPAGFVHLASSGRGHVMLLTATGESGPPDYDYQRYARAGSIAGGFGPPEPMDLGYMVGCCASGADDHGNFTFTASGYDAGTYLLRYRR